MTNKIDDEVYVFSLNVQEITTIKAALVLYANQCMSAASGMSQKAAVDMDGEPFLKEAIEGMFVRHKRAADILLIMRQQELFGLKK